ncbi:PfkB family carbohydrate kinase [Mesoplasma melaleucae]|uniref:PfkB family carbohydrate kinase n=1 Tax=Mesoplasma melaleucae TaxID=81459 RepID=UPI0038CC02FF
MLEGKLKDSYNEIFKLALKNNIKFSFNPNFSNKLWITDEEIKSFKKHFEKFIENANLIKLSKDELLLLTEIEDETKAVQSIINKNAKALICITRGCDDTIFAWKNEINYVSTILAKNLVDTTGARDAFISNLINDYVTL